MADLYANAGDGNAISSITTWAGARDDTDAASISSSDTRLDNFTSVSRFGARGGGSTYNIKYTKIKELKRLKHL